MLPSLISAEHHKSAQYSSLSKVTWDDLGGSVRRNKADEAAGSIHVEIDFLHERFQKVPFLSAE